MYLSNLFIENMGSIEKLQILEKDIFLENGNPKPIILLGKNGSGKTTMLSSITDSLYELANHSFKDILPSDGLGYSYYKVSGGTNKTIGKNYSFSFIQFKNGEKPYEYIDKNGNISYEECKEKTNSLLSIHNKRDNKQNYKSSTDTKKDKKFNDDFKNNTYCVFPANRFEFPHRLNRGTYKKISDFNEINIFNGELKKPILVKSSIDTLKPRILDLFLDSRTGLKKSTDGTSYITTQSAQLIEYLQQGIKNIEKLLSSILGKDISINVNLRGQGNSRLKVVDKNTEEDIIPSLDNLSAGESILLGMFGTIIKYSDLADINKSIKLNNIEGIVVIDEIDLHLHVKLQKEVLPKLIKLFPKIQFIISTHSPFFLYGMNKEFGDDALILNMPSGTRIYDYGDFDEFEEAYQVFDGLTQDYQKKYEQLKKQVEKANRPLIICEGKTDVIHIKKAIEKLGIDDIKNVEFFKIPDEGWGDQQTRNLLENVCKLKNGYKIIGVFDRDNEKIIKFIGNDIKDLGNNVYGFCIPVPKGRKKYNKISIEFYYDDIDLHKEKDGKRLCFSNELYFDNNKQPIELIMDKDKIKEDFDKQIFDENIGNVEGIHSKAKFAELVENDEEFIKDFNFENFRLITNKIKEILGKKNN